MWRGLAFGVLLANAAWGSCASINTRGLIPAYRQDLADAHYRTLSNEVYFATFALQTYLNAASVETREGWKTYLQWKAWAAPLLEQGKWEWDAMSHASSLLYAVKPGLDAQPFIRVRHAFESALGYVFAVRNYGGQMAHEYAVRSRRLSELLAADQCRLDEIDALAVWFASVGQSPALVEALRSTFSKSNVVMRVNPALVKKALEEFNKQESSSKQSVNQIQGAQVVGMNYVTNEASASLVNVGDEARVRIHVKGVVNSPCNAATKGPATVYGSAVSHFTAYADVYWTGVKFAYTTPVAQARTYSQTSSVAAPIIIRRIALNQASKKQAAGEAESAQIVEREAVEEMTKQLAPAVEQLNKQTGEMIAFAHQAGINSKNWRSQVYSDAIEVGTILSPMSGLGARSLETPSLAPGEEMGLSFHQSAVGGTLRPILGGSSWTDLQFASLQKELIGMNSKEFMIGATPERWSVVWDWLSPVILSIEPEGITFRYRFSSVQMDGKNYTSPVELHARFEVVPTNLGVEFRRNSEVEAAAMQAGRELDAGLKAVLERKFAGLFEKVFYLDGIQFPSGGDFDALSKLELSSVKLGHGWMHVSVKQKKE